MAETKAVARKADMLPTPMVALVKELLPDCNVLLPADITTEQFRAGLWLELSGRPELVESPMDDLRLCIIKAAQYGMLPGRDCHYLAFRNKHKGNRRCATFVPNYFGVLRALYRTGMVEQAFAEVVFTNDTYDLDYGRTPMLIHKPPRKHRGVPEGAYGFIQVRGGHRPLIHYMDPDDLDRVRRRAPAHDQGPWVSDTNEMKRKTAMKNVAKYAQLTPLVQQLLEDDDARLQTDIPPARHHQNIVDLFGDDPRGSTPTPATPWCDDCNSAGHYPDECPETAPTPSQATRKARATTGVPTDPPQAQRREGFAWETLAAHKDDSRIPAAILEQIGTALSDDSPATDAEAHTLAEAVLSWLDHADEGEV